MMLHKHFSLVVFTAVGIHVNGSAETVAQTIELGAQDLDSNIACGSTAMKRHHNAAVHHW